jgi:hypothetical protein
MMPWFKISQIKLEKFKLSKLLEVLEFEMMFGCNHLDIPVHIYEKHKGAISCSFNIPLVRTEYTNYSFFAPFVQILIYLMIQ